MRINIYSQELTSETEMVVKKSDGIAVTGIPCYPNGSPSGKPREPLPVLERNCWYERFKPSDMMGLTNPYRDIREEPIIYHAARLVLHSSNRLHHPPMDDDRSALTFWLPKSQERREEMARAFEEIAKIFRNAPRGTGMD